MADPKAPEMEERPGQCAPSDATWSERVESAAALLCLAGPADLLSAVRDAGLTLVVTEDAPAVLTEDASWDAELQALVAIASTLAPLDQGARLRVMRWARARYLPNHVLVQA